MEGIIKEKISADHLMYVSLKYTKTCDIIVNLLIRWRVMIDVSIEKMLKHAKKRKLISAIPDAPRQKIDKIKELFRKNEDVLKVIEAYEMFREIENLEKQRENEFRKNVTLKVAYKGKIIEVNIDKLKEYSEILERFIKEVKHFLSK
ncbi:MAG TPA: hypothetical protein VJA86_04235 [Candidatus Nanoarchaeia archaeon]|nr:hypothetical protein [Candidatus Nanoarchaeia archaeon]